MSDSGSMGYDNLIAGTQRGLVTLPGTVAVGESFSRGTLLGRLTSGPNVGLWRPVDDGENSALDQYGIATEAVDTTGSNGLKVTDIYVEGEFSRAAVILAYSSVIAEFLPPTTAGKAIEDQGIYLRATISTAGV